MKNYIFCRVKKRNTYLLSIVFILIAGIGCNVKKPQFQSCFESYKIQTKINKTGGAENYNSYTICDLSHCKYLLKNLSVLKTKFAKILFTQIDQENINLFVELPKKDTKKLHKEKYYFKDNNDNFFLFKKRPIDNALTELISNHLSIVLGSKTVPVFYKRIFMGTEFASGVMVQLVPDSRCLRKDDLKQLKPFQISTLLSNEAIDIFLMNEDATFDNYLVTVNDSSDKVDKILQIDKDESFMDGFEQSCIENRDSSFVIYFSLWEELSHSKDFNYKIGLDVARFIENFPDELIQKIFDQTLKSYPDLNNYAYVKKWKSELLERKENFSQKYVDIIKKFHYVDLCNIETIKNKDQKVKY